MKYAAIITDSIYHEGDQRSRDNPGHGYPAYTETVTKFHPFKDEAEMKDWVKHQPHYKKPCIIRYEEMKVSTRIEVDVA